MTKQRERREKSFSAPIDFVQDEKVRAEHIMAANKLAYNGQPHEAIQRISICPGFGLDGPVV